MNIADDASRGLDADEILHRDQWIHGPSFLWQEEHRWPVMPEILQVSESSLEIKNTVESFVQVNTTVCGMDRLLERFSSWLKLKKATAWLLRFKQWLLQRSKGTEFTSAVYQKHLTVQELKTAEVQLVKYLQRCHFHEEIDCRKRGEQVKKSSPLYKLDPVLNCLGVLCVGGRLGNAPIPEESKHPMIIPKNHYVGVLISSHYHEVLGHSGREHVLSHMRQKLWLINARTTINKILRKCVHCRRHQGIQSSQQMATLPKERVTPHKPPFTYVGVDCFGPFLVKRGRSLVKRYGCLFTCLTVRAIHIEKLDSMETDSFINALTRFEARRGKPEIIRSDNGTNFKGANQELKQAIRELDQSKIYNSMLDRDIQWIFNPPTASHMGGVRGKGRFARCAKFCLLYLANRMASVMKVSIHYFVKLNLSSIAGQ
ncbi:uncharacterized protein LOC124290772 [Haliotis rubra]|uniref:uncharacterized protein LOC124290772 n=1 Tax=Haliotis rubra TaxID=36100 RepID=UPI001EE4FDD6|nr:uncharacterized protein LOC124290772 [Haliotis rubra]